MPPPEPRMAALLQVRGGSAPVLDEEQREPAARPDEVLLLRVQRSQRRVGRDAQVETLNQPFEVGQAADLVVERRLEHGPDSRGGRGVTHGPGAFMPLNATPLQSPPVTAPLPDLIPVSYTHLRAHETRHE